MGGASCSPSVPSMVLSPPWRARGSQLLGQVSRQPAAAPVTRAFSWNGDILSLLGSIARGVPLNPPAKHLTALVERRSGSKKDYLKTLNQPFRDMAFSVDSGAGCTAGLRRGRGS